MKLSVFSFVRPDFPDGHPLTLYRRQGFQIILSNRYALHFTVSGHDFWILKKIRLKLTEFIPQEKCEIKWFLLLLAHYYSCLHAPIQM